MQKGEHNGRSGAVLKSFERGGGVISTLSGFQKFPPP